MPLSSLDQATQNGLKRELQDEIEARKFERLTVALISRLLDVPVAVAQSGFQYGGDAGPAGRRGRRFRLECKKYSDTTSLSARELLGEIDHAIARDRALEAWFLAATRVVSEQLLQDLTNKGEECGVPVVIIDWREHELAPLAALCAFAPDVVETLFSSEAGRLARALQPIATSAIEELRQDLQAWSLGFDSLRSRSHAKLDAIWTQPRASNAALGQIVAGGAQPKKIRRQTVNNALSSWWRGRAADDAPAAIVGADGVGKTWATLDWLVDQKDLQPIILLVPSSAAAIITAASEMDIKSFLASRLYELTGVRDVKHWRCRLDYLLQRPTSEGPVLTVWFDGLNQEASVDWLQVLKVLQAEPFAGRIRVMASTRPHHFNDRLSRLAGLVVPHVRIQVDGFDAAAGGELDQMLALEGLARANLHPDLIELARTPRLFNLVVRLRDRLVEAERVTVHRLLWEYGRDALAERAGRSFSESEWREWLQDIAQRYRDGMKQFTVRVLGETANRADLSKREVYQRLSDIVDGQFATTDASGRSQLTPTVVAHALGADLLAQLDEIGASTFEAVEALISQWLDPIAGLDQRAEILRAAVSILLERGGPVDPIAGVLVTAWLQSQNVTDSHRRELTGLAEVLVEALLDAIQHSNQRTHASARLWAINALRSIPRQDGPALAALVRRGRTWLSRVSRELDLRPEGNPEFERRRAERYERKIGRDASGPVTVLGVPLEVVDRDGDALANVVPTIIEGFPLTSAISCFEAAAVSQSINHSDSWKGLKWLCYFNEQDSLQTSSRVRELSEDLRQRTPEAGIHPDLPARAAALVLWLCGEEADERKAIALDPGIDHHYTYEKDYLSDPAHSFFALERRHGELALSAADVPLVVRIQRVANFFIDPQFEPPVAFVNELLAFASGFDLQSVNCGRNYTREDQIFENLELALAACAPDALGNLVRRKLQSLATRSAEARYAAAIQCTRHFLLAGAAEAEAARALRISGRDTDDGDEAVAAGHLLMLELPQLDTVEQFQRVIEVGLKFISVDFREVLNRPTHLEVDALIAQYRGGPTEQLHDLVILLSIHPIAFSDPAWTWFGDLARDPHFDLRGLVFRMLEEADAVRFGRMLVADEWTWMPDAEYWVNDSGSGALIAAEAALPFEQLAPRLAPWRVLEAARRRGADAGEVMLAAEIVGHVLAAPKLEEPDPGSDLSIERSSGQSKRSVLSAEPRVNPSDVPNPFAAFNAKVDEQIAAYRRAIDTATERIDVARKAGASLYLADLSAADMEPVVLQVPEVLESWLEGSRDRTIDFRRRVRLAEGAYLALCEALLRHDPPRGAELWRALRVSLATRYIGGAGIDELLHIVFRVPDSIPVAALRLELLDLQHCHTDQALFELAIAAAYNGESTWLDTVIENDRASPLVWRRMRAEVLQGFTVGGPVLAIDEWPKGWYRATWDGIRQTAARLRGADACARHWWRKYLTAGTPEDAYAAWVLFMASADRRAIIWQNEEVQTFDDQSDFFDRKLNHVQLNRSELKNAMKKRPDQIDRKFLDHDPVNGVGPWGKRWH